MSDDGPISADVVTGAGIPGYNGGGRLHPFTRGDPRAVELGRRSAEVRKSKQALRRATSQEASAHLASLRLCYDRGTLGDSAAVVALDLLGRVSRGEIAVRNGSEAAELFRALVDVVRLESGESTSNTIVAHLSGDPLARFRELQLEAQSVLGRGELARAAGVEHEDEFPGADRVGGDGDG